MYAEWLAWRQSELDELRAEREALGLPVDGFGVDGTESGDVDVAGAAATATADGAEESRVVEEIVEEIIDETEEILPRADGDG